MTAAPATECWPCKSLLVPSSVWSVSPVQPSSGALPARRRRWLAGDSISLADITAAAHLSAIDYIGDVPWQDHPAAKDWYVRIKSRPSFKPLLEDVIPGFPPPSHYQNLDF